MNTRVAILTLGLLLAAVALFAFPGAGVETGANTTPDMVIDECAEEPPDDFADPDAGNEVIGWVDGYWYNEPLSIDTTDGLSGDELEQLSARTSARFEAMRCLPAVDGVPPVQIINRSEFQQDIGSGAGTDGMDGLTDDELFENAKFDTLFFAPEQEQAGEVRDEQRGQTTAGYYNFLTKEIVIITDDPEGVLLDEDILAHELGHAIQDQHFNVSQYQRPTVDQNNAKLGLIEGDVHWIEHRYRNACEQDRWEQACISTRETDTDSGATGQPDLPSWGLYIKNFQPYSDGPAFVEYVYERQGWEGVNELYDDPPQSAMEVANPERYGEFERVDVVVSDRSSESWDPLVRERLTSTPGNKTYDTIGISGIIGMFAEPALAGETDDPILSIWDIQNINEAGLFDRENPYEYLHPETEGWKGDSLRAYVNGDHETATVWQLEWDSPEAMVPFVEAYGDLVEIYGGEPVPEYNHTYAFGEESEFNRTVTIAPSGDTVTIVSAPTVGDLENVHEGIFALQEPLPDGSSNSQSGTGETSNGETNDGGEIDDSDSSSGSGEKPTEGADGNPIVIFVAVFGGLFIIVVALLDMRRW